MECTHCNLTFKTKYTLKSHILNSKTCLKKRGLTLETKFTCEACCMSFASNINLNVHIDSCKKYIIYKSQQEYEKILKEKDTIIHKQKQEIEAFTKQLAYYTKLEFKYDAIAQQYDDIKHINNDHKKLSIEYTELKVSYKELTKQHEELKTQHEKMITKLEVKISQCDAFIQTLAREGSNKATTTNNTVNNTIRNVLSPTYTIDKLEPKQLEQQMREQYTERDFFGGQKGLANFCVERIIKTPDGKMMICCSDTSRKKFKILDIKGNLKEDIEARLLCEKLKIPIQTVTKTIYDKIIERIDEERTRLSSDDRSRREKLLDDTMRAQQIYIDNLNFDDLNYNQDFMHELCVLLNV
jgi:hypothetical protein